MDIEEERIYTQYFYNSVIEFIYFIILYLETHENVSLIILSKYIKLFKFELTNLISSFEGKSLDDKLHEFLNSLDCFSVDKNYVKIKKNTYFKNFFEDLVLSKSVDLILKGLNNMDDICKNLNYNNIITINKQVLLQSIEKYPNISIKNDKTITLHHLHGLLGFEDNVRNSVISYFHNILHYGKIMNVKDIQSHSKCLTFCGIHNIVIIFSILKCSDQFVFQNGYIWLKQKSVKYPKKQRICVDQMDAKYLSRSLHVSQIVYSRFGNFLYKWSGEIGKLTDSSGFIYCVVDFTNGYQGVFLIAFNKESLKIISEMESLEKYLNLRDAVEFDAEYYSSKKLDRCWRATRIKLINKSKFEYDEVLFKKLSDDTELFRNKCTKCYSNINYVDNYDLKVKDLVQHNRQLPEIAKVKNYELCSKTNDNIKHIIYSQRVIKNNLDMVFPNLFIPKYAFMFGYIHMLMKDKLVAIAKHEDKFYNILFMKNSTFPQSKHQNIFEKGQKILAVIPYVKKLEKLPVATLVYGLNDQEAIETEESNILPQEFTDKLLIQNNIHKACDKFFKRYNLSKNLKVDNVIADLKLKVEIAELHNFIENQYKISFQAKKLLQFLYALSVNLDNCNFNKKIFHIFVDLSKNIQNKYFTKRKLKTKESKNEFNSQDIIQLKELSIDAVTKTYENDVTNSILNLKSLDIMQDKLTSSTDSDESFYSCETIKYSSDLSLNECSSVSNNMEEKSSEKVPNTEFEQIDIFSVPSLDFFVPIDSSQKNKLKSKNCKKVNSKFYKHLGLQSCSRFKSVKRKRIASSCTVKSLCWYSGINSCTTEACISMVSNSFFFLTTKIDDENVVLPVPKQNIPQNFQENMKLNSFCEINVIPSCLVNLSPVISTKIII